MYEYLRKIIKWNIFGVQGYAKRLQRQGNFHTHSQSVADSPVFVRESGEKLSVN